LSRARLLVESVVDFNYAFCMSFEQVIAELPNMTFEQRQALIRRAVELDDSPLSDSDEALVEQRLAAHRADPTSSIPLEKFKRQLRARSKA
jgi:hypothetical protein